MFEFNLGHITLNKHKIVLQKWILDDKKTQIVLQDDQITQIVGATSTLNTHNLHIDSQIIKK
jgi:hypothetical protein